MTGEGTATIVHRYRDAFLGINRDGVLLIEHATVTPELGAMYRFILCKGELHLGKDQRPLIDGSTSYAVEGYNYGVNPQTTLQPFDQFGRASLDFNASLGEERISPHRTFIHQDKSKGQELLVEVPITMVVNALQGLLVTQPCDHGFHILTISHSTSKLLLRAVPQTKTATGRTKPEPFDMYAATYTSAHRACGSGILMFRP